MKLQNKVVLVFGTFDLLHAGHRSFLRQAKSLGKKLIVVVGRDANVSRIKKHPPIHGERRRLAAVRRLPYVDCAVLGSKNPQRRFSLIKLLKPDVIALGYDQRYYTSNLARDLKRNRIRCEIVRLKPFRASRYKSSLIRKRLARKKTS